MYYVICFRKKSVLEIPFVSGDHEGNYSCIGTNFKDTPAVNYFTLQLKGKLKRVNTIKFGRMGSNFELKSKVWPHLTVWKFPNMKKKNYTF